MDAERFVRELPALFDDFPRSELPRDARFAEILKGASLVAAMLGNGDRQFVAIDSFALAGGSRATLEANLRSFGLDPPEILEGDVFELLDGGVLEGRRVGVC